MNKSIVDVARLITKSPNKSALAFGDIKDCAKYLIEAVDVLEFVKFTTDEINESDLKKARAFLGKLKS